MNPLKLNEDLEKALYEVGLYGVIYAHDVRDATAIIATATSFAFAGIIVLFASLFDSVTMFHIAMCLFAGTALMIALFCKALAPSPAWEGLCNAFADLREVIARHTEHQEHRTEAN